MCHDQASPQSRCLVGRFWLVHMRESPSSHTAPVIGPLGLALTLDDLPPPHTKRWVIRRKAEIVIAVNSGLLSLNEACDRYALSQEEFMAWERSFRDFGLEGLHVTRALSEGELRPRASRRRVKRRA